jgi:predicted AAA+ superfamily ATPase
MLFKRKVLSKVMDYMDDRESIVIQGARQVGKTSIMKLIMQELEEKGITKERLIYMDLEDFKLLKICNDGIDSLLNYIDFKYGGKEKVYLFIDEIQYLDHPSSLIKLLCDHHAQRIKLIVSGSSTFDIKKKFKDSLVGRIFIFPVYPLDFEEFLLFKGWDGNIKANYPEVLNETIKPFFLEYLKHGAYPEVTKLKTVEKKINYLQHIIELYIKKDIRDIGNIRNIDKFNNLLRYLSDMSGEMLIIENAANDLGISKDTVNEYIFLLENTYIACRISPFYRNIKTELKKTPKIFLYDTGIMNTLRLIGADVPPDGKTFETGVCSLLLKKMGKERLKYWRTSNKQEIDFIVMGDKLRAYEVKKKYPGEPSAFSYFRSQYPGCRLKVVSLEGRVKTGKPREFIYPWEIYRE